MTEPLIDAREVESHLTQLGDTPDWLWESYARVFEHFDATAGWREDTGWFVAVIGNGNARIIAVQDGEPWDITDTEYMMDADGIRLYIDMDGVLADYDARAKELSKDYDGPEDPTKFKWHRREDHFYRKLEPVDGAVEAFHELSQRYDTYLLSTPSWTNPNSWTDKRLWAEEHLGDWAKKRLILAHDKHLLQGNVLIDDKAENGQGFRYFIHFGSDEWPDWGVVLSHLL